MQQVCQQQKAPAWPLTGLGCRTLQHMEIDVRTGKCFCCMLGQVQQPWPCMRIPGVLGTHADAVQVTRQMQEPVP